MKRAEGSSSSPFTSLCTTNEEVAFCLCVHLPGADLGEGRGEWR